MKATTSFLITLHEHKIMHAEASRTMGEDSTQMY